MEKFFTRAKQFVLKEENRYLQYGWILIAYLVAFFFVEQLIPIEACRPTDMPVDRHIPLLLGFVLPYVSWFPMLAVMALILAVKDHEAYKRYMVFMGVAFMSTLVIYLIIPTCQNLRPEQVPEGGFFSWILAQVYGADNNANVCPSLHVIGAFAVCFAAWDAKELRKPMFQGAVWLVAFVVAISTVFMKQHGIVDLIIAVPYSFGMRWVVYKLIYER